MPHVGPVDDRVPTAVLARVIDTLRGRGHSVATIATHARLDRGDIYQIAGGRWTWVRPTTAAAISRAWQALKDRPPAPLGTVERRREALDAVDHSGRSAAQVAALTGLSVRTVKRRRTARRTATGGQVAA